MNAMTWNWVIFAASFAVFSLLAAPWLRARRAGGHGGDDARQHADPGGSGGNPHATPGPPTAGFDPVSGERLDMSRALPCFHRGKVYFFASEATRTRFAMRKTATASISTHEDRP